MKIYIVDCDIQWDLEEGEDPTLPETLLNYEVDVDEGEDLAHKIVEQLTDDYGYCINGVAYDVKEEIDV